MIICPNCNHQNPEGAVQCEACYTPLPALATCSQCGATVQADASFCGQCGFHLKSSPPKARGQAPEVSSPLMEADLLELTHSSLQGDELQMTESGMCENALFEGGLLDLAPAENATLSVEQPLEALREAQVLSEAQAGEDQWPSQLSQATPNSAQKVAQLLHVKTNTVVQLPQHLSVIHIGKPNSRVPPDLDVSGFPDAEVVSRVHADIRAEGDEYFLEDVGSANGTYVNNLPLSPGNRHRLSPGDRIALGKEDKVAFLFQLA